MSDKVPQSTPAEQAAGHRSAIPPVSLDKRAAAPAADEAPVRDATPAPGSVHHQQTLTSLPTPSAPAAPVDAAPAPWASPAGGLASPAPEPQPSPFAPQASVPQQPNPFAPPAPSQQNPFAPPASGPQQQNPFAPPASAPQQQNPFAPPAPGQQQNPFAPPASAPHQQNPFAPPAPSAAPHGGTEPVPPPPIAPDGPGQVPYGYPGTTAAYGYPGTPNASYPAGYGYGWPGMQPAPSNGMGTASLVLGILSAVLFLAWPVAMVLGILALIFGVLGRGKAKRGEATNPGMALAGLICGAAGFVLALGFFVIVIVVNT